MGNELGDRKGDLANALKDYTVVQQIAEDNITFLEQKETHEDILMREFCFNDLVPFENTVALLQLKQTQLAGSVHVVRLLKFIQAHEQHFCSKFYKIYAFFEYPQRTLDSEINDRNQLKNRFQEKQIWSILASCILGLSHLQKNEIPHSALRSTTILIDHLGVVKLADPFATGCNSNYDAILTKRSLQHIYLSPQLVDCLQQELIATSCHPFKADIWTLGMIILEVGLMQYQDECYRDDCSRIHWETLQYHLKLFSQLYSPELTALTKLMLSREEAARPDWIELEDHVMKVDEDARRSMVSQGPQLSNSNIVPSGGFIQSITSSQANFKPVNKQIKPSSQVNSSQVAASLDGNILKRKDTIGENALLVRGQVPTKTNWHQPKDSEVKPVMLTPNGPVLNTVFSGLAISDINRTRPMRNVFPSSTYTVNTRIDENLVIVQGDQASEQGEYVIETFKMGSRYQGWKVKGMRHGTGKFYYQDGGMYDGDWAFNKMSGFGRLYYQSGLIAYEGNWSQDKFNDMGSLFNDTPQFLNRPFNYKDLNEVEDFWTKYEGMFLNDMKHGKGTLRLTNGQYFEGNFANDLAEGPGCFYVLGGPAVTGRWEMNRLKP